jgi:formylglycine-generating enzyme required for sulfatase activity
LDILGHRALSVASVLIAGAGFWVTARRATAEKPPVRCPAGMITTAPEGHCIDRAPVTVGQYMACSASGRCKRPALTNWWPGISEAEREAFDPLCNGRDPVTRSTRPVNCLDWESASLFCGVQGKRLPTVAEWPVGVDDATGPVREWVADSVGPSAGTPIFRDRDVPELRSYRVAFRCATGAR